MKWLLALVVLAGCQRVFDFDAGPPADAEAVIDSVGPPPADAKPPVDLDGDGMRDDIDPCIAGPREASDDEDGDTIKNGEDPCPLNPPGAMQNDDSDALPNACDPVQNTAGDEPRCFMGFADPALTNALWAGRSGEAPWGITAGKIAANAAGLTATMIATESIEGRNTTSYQAQIALDPHQRQGSVTLWLRADPAAKNTADVGCRAEIQTATSDQIELEVLGPSGRIDGHIVTIPATGTSTLRIQGTLPNAVPLGTTVIATCRFTLNSGATQTASGNVPLAAGRAGFSVEHFEASVLGLYITDRD